MGEPELSPRRNQLRGIETKYTINPGQKDEIGIFLLDERYYRDPLPCYTKRAYCEDILQNRPNDRKFGWCNDFLNGKEFGSKKIGTCCDKDEKIFFGWCKEEANKYPFT